MKLSVSQTAKLCGISVRTLHYYDQIGLVRPSQTLPNGYRYYDEAALSTLQQVLFYRELEFPLKQIRSMMQRPDYDKRQALEAHRELLLLKRRHIDGLLRLLDDTIGGIVMQENRTTLETLRAAKKRYAKEAEARYGGTPQWKQSQARARSEAEEAAALTGADEIFAGFAALAAGGVSPESGEAHRLACRWQEHITAHYYDCTDAMLKDLAELYVQDERFCQNLDRYGAGTAQMIHDAILSLCNKER